MTTHKAGLVGKAPSPRSPGPSGSRKRAQPSSEPTKSKSASSPVPTTPGPKCSAHDSEEGEEVEEILEEEEEESEEDDDDEVKADLAYEAESTTDEEPTDSSDSESEVGSDRATAPYESLMKIGDMFNNARAAGDVPHDLVLQTLAALIANAQRAGAPTAAPDAANAPPKQTQCNGKCVKFSCIRQCRSVDEFAAWDLNRWMLDHGLVDPPKCPKHPDYTGPNLKGASKGRELCGFTDVVDGKRIRCRLAVGGSPWQTGTGARSRLAMGGPAVAFMILVGLAVHRGPEDVLASCQVSTAKPVQELRRIILRCAKAVTEQGPPLHANIVQVNETMVGKRKYNKGKRPRKDAFWMVTVTSIDPAGKTIASRWHPVVKRSAAALKEIITRHLVGPRSHVITDGFAAYVGTGLFAKHDVVDHDQCFAEPNEAGKIVHTNNAEGGHGVVKQRMRSWRKRHGSNTAEVAAFFQLGGLLIGSGSKWVGRLVRLLEIVREGLPLLESTELDFVPDDNESTLGRPPLAREVRRERNAAGQAEKKAKAARKPLSKARAEQAAHDNSQRNKSERASAAASISGPNSMLDDFAVDTLMRHVLSFQTGPNPMIQLLSNWWQSPEISGMTHLRARTTYLLPVCAHFHWVLYEITPDAVILWDSIGDSYPKHMEKVSAKVLERVRVSDSRAHITEVTYSTKSEQQGASAFALGSDCGLFVLNHARIVSRTEAAVEKITRANAQALLQAQWNKDDEEWNGTRYGHPILN